MTALDFDNMRAVAKAATAGPWKIGHDLSNTELVQVYSEARAVGVSQLEEYVDAAFIATFNPLVVLQLLDLAQHPPAHPDTAKWRELLPDSICRHPVPNDHCVVCKARTELHAAADACDRLEDKDALADRLAIAWRRYQDAFHAVPHGTVKQLRALLELMPAALKPAGNDNASGKGE